MADDTVSDRIAEARRLRADAKIRPQTIFDNDPPNTYSREYYAAHIEELKEKQQVRAAKRREEINARQRELYAAQREYRRAWARAWYLKNRDKILANQHTPEGRERISVANKKWRSENPQYFIDNRDKINEKNHRSRDKHPVSNALRSRVITAVKKCMKGSVRGKAVGSAVRDLGCSIPEFMEYIAAQFKPGMTWENRGRYTWHLDHIRPLSSFNLLDPEEFKKAAHFSNYQPLWAVDNLSKASKEKPRRIVEVHPPS